MGCKRMIISNKEKTVVIELHSGKILQRTEIIAEVQKARRSDAT